ncbi:hypothetical protein CC77DRAFT_1005711 [Alternaria alternata]|uniref:Rhodopsin domain-containing protein n=1 Tax=Alternaria alternata TaxID=5599 RepID=A0A177DZ49_ALTAL|nr:hypothetical protein CC77DRAFT_1005711 [Alternaria alternata]OAG24768.1 hypothetical protein CC77DRAFT_1005711 [Alternaria alternata]
MYPEHKGQAVYILSVVSACTTFLVLLLRFWSRSLHASGFRSDDWTAAAAWPFVLAISVQTGLLLHHGFGLHITSVPPANMTFSLQVLYAGYLTYTAAMALIRISVGLFYHRLFSVACPNFRYQVHANTLLNVIWLVGLNLAAAFECTPVSAFWDKGIEGAKCMPTLNIQLGSVVPSVVLDLIALIMPLPIIWKLQLSMQRKVMLLGTFVLGYSVIFLSVGRLITVAKIERGLESDLTWYFVDVLIWLHVEMSVASICISLPSCFSMVRRAREGGVGALISSRPLPQKYQKQDADLAGGMAPAADRDAV